MTDTLKIIYHHPDLPNEKWEIRIDEGGDLHTPDGMTAAEACFLVGVFCTSGWEVTCLYGWPLEVARRWMPSHVIEDGAE
jgi:hypothetical protein